MSRVVLVHWHEAEAKERAARLAAMGHEVTTHWRQDDGGTLTRAFAAALPDAVVVDLGRLPSHGRAIATWLRERKASRHVPLVFVPGDEEKTARLREAFPDAAYAPWSRLRTSLAKAIARPPREPVVPKAPDYSGTPLWKKLGVKPGGRLLALRTPHELDAMLGELPAGVTVATRATGEAAVVLLFVRSLAQLRADWPAAARCLGEKAGLWIAWPKKASGQVTDLTDEVVRAFGLDQGLVDNKVCAVDATWSGLRFARRVAKPGAKASGK